MADNTTLDPGTGGDTIRDKDRAGIKTPIVALDLNPAGAETLMAGAMPVTDNGGTLSVDDGGGSITVDNGGTFAVQADTELTTADLDTGAGTDTRAVVGLVIAKSGGAANISSSDPLPISDAGGSLTVDGTVTVQDGGGAISVDDNGSTLSVDDGGGSITVDGTVGVSGTVTVDSELTTADVDTGAGTDTRAVVGLVLAASGGGVLAGTANPVPISDNGGSVTVDGTVTANLGTAAVTNAGTFAVQDSDKVADDAAFTVATTKVQPAGYLADESSTDSVDEGDAGAARMTLDRKQIVTVEPHTAGGWDVKNCTSGDGSTALTNTAQAIKASAGKLGGWFIYNPNSSAVYVPIYNVASGSVTVGTTNPLMVLCIPATSAANLEMVNGLTFDTAISVAAATTAAGNGAPTTALEANFFFK